MKILFVLNDQAEIDYYRPIWQSLKAEQVIISWKLDGLPDISQYHTKNIVKILKEIKPNLVIVGNDYEILRRAFVYASNKLEIPTLLLRLGVASNESSKSTARKRSFYRLSHNLQDILQRFSYYLRTMIGLHWSPVRIACRLLQDIRLFMTVDDAVGHFCCTKIAIAGSWTRDILKERGVNSEIVITGVAGLEKPQTKRMWGDKVILLLTSAYVEHGWWTPEQRDTLMKGIVDTLKGYNLIFKLHPAENVRDYPYPNVYNNIKAIEAVNSADVVIVSGYSTVVLEACSLRKPVILLNVFKEPEYVPYVKMGIVQPCYDLNDLKRSVTLLLLTGSKMKLDLLKGVDKFLLDNYQSFDGNAQERLIQTIMETAR